MVVMFWTLASPRTTLDDFSACLAVRITSLLDLFYTTVRSALVLELCSRGFCLVPVARDGKPAVHRDRKH